MRDGKGNNHKAAGRPDGGQFDRKAGQGSDDDLDMVPAFDPKHLTDDDILALRARNSRRRWRWTSRTSTGGSPPTQTSAGTTSTPCATGRRPTP